MSKTQDLVPQDDPTVGMALIDEPAKIAAAIEALQNGTVPPELGDPAITARLIRQRIFDGSFEESLEPVESLTPWATYMNEPVVVQSFHLNPSGFSSESGIAVYAVVELMLLAENGAGGEIIAVSEGGSNVLAQLLVALRDGKLPFRAMLTETKTAGGFSVHRLQKA